MTELALTEPDLDKERDAQTTVHGTSVAIGGAGLLLRGPPGSGKSDLALRLIEIGGSLVSDDQTVLRRAGSDVLMSAPSGLVGKLEVRSIGIVRMQDAGPTSLRMVVDLVSAAETERLPARRTTRLLGLDIPCVRLDPVEISAAIKLKLALSHPDLN